MEFSEWELFYEAILDDFGFSRKEDRRGAELLDGMLDTFLDTNRLQELLAGNSVVVAGDGPSLADELGVCRAADAVIAADAAARRLDDAGITPDVVCTDLDGAPEHEARLSRNGTLVAIHAHGDNQELLEQWVPAFDHANVLGTTQTAPFGQLHNVGGFTDGDRCAFLADAFGAATITLAGFDMDDPDVGPEKAKKLRWAGRLLRVLEERRGEPLR